MNKNLSAPEAKSRISKLSEVIDDYRYRYHVLDEPNITDAQYDSLMRELVQLEERFPQFKDPNSPSQKIGGEPLQKFKKVTHTSPMLSLQDAFNEKELQDWYIRLKKLVGEENIIKSGFYTEIKMDGLAISLVYEKGVLKYASTRGDGKVGEDVTENIKTIKSIPLMLRKNSKYYLQAQKSRIEIRGEVYMPKATFEKLNSQRKAQGEVLFANPRNAAAGSVRQLDPKICRQRNLDFISYGLIGLNLERHELEHRVAQDLGFPSNKYNQFCTNITQIISLWHKWSKLRAKLPYQIDGMVINIDSVALFEKLGVAGKAPRGALALKWPAEETSTILLDIIVQVGRTGKLTPVAILEPVEVAGSIVSRATLHNQDEIDKKDVRIGDTVLIRKAGDIIPEVVEPLKKLRNGKEKKFSIISYCQKNHIEVIKKEGEVDYFIKDKNSFDIRVRQIEHFVSKKAFNIDGLGTKIIEKLLNEGLIKDEADIFNLTNGDLEPLERFAQKSAQNLLDSIEASKRILLSRFIYSLGIRNVGEETAYDLAEFFIRQSKNQKNPNYLDQLQSTDLENLQKLPDIGPVVAQSIYDYFQDKKNLNLIFRLKTSGIKIIPDQIISKKLSGQTFVLTGTLQKYSRDIAQDLIRKLGGNIASAVSKKTDFVIAGKESGSKLVKAKKLNIKILTEEEFENIIQ